MTTKKMNLLLDRANAIESHLHEMVDQLKERQRKVNHKKNYGRYAELEFQIGKLQGAALDVQEAINKMEHVL